MPTSGASFTGTTEPFAKLRAFVVEARAMLATLRALAAGRIVLARDGRKTVVGAGWFQMTDGSRRVWAEANDDEAFVMVTTDYDGDLIRVSDDDLDVAS